MGEHQEQPVLAASLSECISRLVEQKTCENQERFFQVFLRSRLGVIVTRGGALLSDAQRPSGRYVLGKNEGLGLTTTEDGKETILACADLATYVQRFTVPFNAEVEAMELLKAAWSDLSCDGITINSAASDNSIFIPREQIAKLIHGDLPIPIPEPETNI
jgi:hypothetical protein